MFSLLLLFPVCSQVYFKVKNFKAVLLHQALNRPSMFVHFTFTSGEFITAEFLQVGEGGGDVISFSYFLALSRVYVFFVLLCKFISTRPIKWQTLTAN